MKYKWNAILLAALLCTGLGGSSGRNAGGKRFCNGGPGSAGSQPDGGAKYGADGSREGSENVQLSTRYV